MSLVILNVDEVKRTLSAPGGAFVVHDKEVDIVRFAINSGFADIVLDGQVALRVMYQRPGESQVRAQTLTYYDTDGLRNYYDWHLLPSDLAEKGTLTVALCILRTDGDVEEWHTTPCQIRVLDTIHTDDSDEADESITPTVAQRVAILEAVTQRLYSMAGGAPAAVPSVSDMTDTEKIYVLTTDGNWYWYNGSGWSAGGEYGAVATDRTLSEDGFPADAKAAGDAVKNLKDELRDTISISKNTVRDITWENGYISNPTTGNITSSAKRIMTHYLMFEGDYEIVYPVSMQLHINSFEPAWDGTTRQSTSGWKTGGRTWIRGDSAYKYVLTLQYADGSDIVPSDGAGISIRKKDLSHYDVLRAASWTQGTTRSDGTITTSPTRLSSSDIMAFPCGGEMLISLTTGFAMGIRSGPRSDSMPSNVYWLKHGDIYNVPAGHNYFRYIVARDAGNSSQSAISISPSDMEGIACGFLYKKIPSVFEGNSEGIKKADAARLIFNSEAGSSNSVDTRPVLAHTSDIHGDAVRLKRFADFCDDYHVDIGMITGDIVAYNAADRADFLTDIISTHSSKFGICIGNHDVRGNITDAEVYNYLLSPIAEKIGNTTEKNYYYTDISEKSLRIISVSLYEEGIVASGNTRTSMQHMSSEQLNWLCEALLSTPEDYGVVIAMHTLQGAASFDSEHPVFYQHPLKYSSAGNTSISGKPVYDIIDAFIGRTTIDKTYTQTGTPSSISVSADFSEINSGVEFVAYMVGHWHEDAIAYANGTQYTQLILNVTCGNALYGGPAYPYLCDVSDLPRNSKTITQDAFNIYVIDRIEKLVKVVRIGSDVKYDMTEREYAEYSYV